MHNAMHIDLLSVKVGDMREARGQTQKNSLCWFTCVREGEFRQTIKCYKIEEILKGSVEIFGST